MPVGLPLKGSGDASRAASLAFYPNGLLPLALWLGAAEGARQTGCGNPRDREAGPGARESPFWQPASSQPGRCFSKERRAPECP